MISSMFTAITALNSYQYMMSVISDNIANGNTVGYKPSRVTFQDQFAQMINGGSAPTATTGGTNPTQIGSGVRIGTVTPIFIQGMLKPTSRNMDLSLQGNGFMIYKNGNDMFYSRDGSLEMDSDGYLVNSTTGLRLQGWMVPAGTATVDTNQAVTEMQIPLNKTLARATSTTIFGGNLDSSALIRAVQTPPPAAGDAAYADYKASTFEATYNVYDSLGEQHSLTMRFTHNAANEWTWDIPQGADYPSNAGVTGSGAITFNTDGSYDSISNATVTFPGSAGSVASNPVVIDFSQVTMLSDTSNAAAINQNGLSAGTVNGIYISPSSGEIYINYSNGLREKVAQIAVANFVNPSGLIREGQNLFSLGVNSGEPQVGAANTGGRGQLVSGYLEESRVDLGTEFSNLIVAQRGFQASARIITASDEMIVELVNLKR